MGKKDNWLKHMKRMIKPSSPQPETSRNSAADNEILEEEERGLNRIGEDASMVPSTPEKITEEMNGAGNIHALAIANATAAASAAAAAAARAAAEVVRLASNGISAHDHNYFPDLQISGVTREDRAATKIQAAFRGHLAKKALRALKGIVKLQAVVRGYCVRKQARMTLRCMQTLIRLQSRVRSRQILLMDSAPTNYSQPNLNASKIPTAALQGRRINATADYCYASDLQPAYCNHPAKRLALVEVSDGGYRDWGWMEGWAEGSMNESSYLRDDVSGKESILLSSGGASLKSSEDSGAN